jgi:hypothetical protein
MISSASEKFPHFSQSQSVTFSAFIHFGNLLLLHCLQNSGIVYHVSTPISTDIISKEFVLDSKQVFQQINLTL